MHSDWNMDGQADAPLYPFDGEQAEHVVPADGDPALEQWEAARHAQQRTDAQWQRTSRLASRMVAPRRGLRWGTLLVLLALLVLLIAKPLVALVAIAVAVVGVVVLVGILAAGTLLLAARMVLGTRQR